MERRQVFELTDEHLELMKHWYVGWQDMESGAPQIDPKRPYGNSNVPGDVAEILGWQYDPDDDMPDHMYKAAWELHKETQTALQIVLRTQSFKTGWYECIGYGINWQYIPERDEL